MSTIMYLNTVLPSGSSARPFSTIGKMMQHTTNKTVPFTNSVPCNVSPMPFYDRLLSPAEINTYIQNGHEREPLKTFVHNLQASRWSKNQLANGQVHQQYQAIVESEAMMNGKKNRSSFGILLDASNVFDAPGGGSFFDIRYVFPDTAAALQFHRECVLDNSEQNPQNGMPPQFREENIEDELPGTEGRIFVSSTKAWLKAAETHLPRQYYEAAQRLRNVAILFCIGPVFVKTWYAHHVKGPLKSNGMMRSSDRKRAINICLTLAKATARSTIHWVESGLWPMNLDHPSVKALAIVVANSNKNTSKKGIDDQDSQGTSSLLVSCSRSACNVVCPKMKRCPECKTPFCSTKCFKIAWKKEGHKQDCPTILANLLESMRKQTFAPDYGILRRIVASGVLSDQSGWSSIINPLEIYVEELGQFNARDSYKMCVTVKLTATASSRNNSLSPIVFHAASETFTENGTKSEPNDEDDDDESIDPIDNINFSLLCRKTAAATIVLSDVGIAPRRLATGKNWYIEEYVNNSTKLNSKWANTPERWDRIGRLLAKIHKTPTDWFAPYRQEIVHQYPYLSNLPEGNRAWNFFGVPCYSSGSHRDGMKKLIQDMDFFHEWTDFGPDTPRHPLAQKIVTIHNKFQFDNILETSDDDCLYVVDVACMTVNYAVIDMIFFLGGSRLSTGGLKNSQLFLKGYIKEAYGSEHVTDDEVNELMCDVRLCGLSRELQLENLSDLSIEEAKIYLANWKVFVTKMRALPLHEQLKKFDQFEKSTGGDEI